MTQPQIPLGGETQDQIPLSHLAVIVVPPGVLCWGRGWWMPAVVFPGYCEGWSLGPSKKIRL